MIFVTWTEQIRDTFAITTEGEEGQCTLEERRDNRSFSHCCSIHTQTKIEKKAKAIAAWTLLRPFQPAASFGDCCRHWSAMKQNPMNQRKTKIPCRKKTRFSQKNKEKETHLIRSIPPKRPSCVFWYSRCSESKHLDQWRPRLKGMRWLQCQCRSHTHWNHYTGIDRSHNLLGRCMRKQWSQRPVN